VPVTVVASVNVNGVRAAARRGMGAWLAERRPDVLCLQEVRAPDDVLRACLGDGWQVAHAEPAGDASRGRAGVAVASRLPLGPAREEVLAGAGRWVEADVAVPGGTPLTVASVYVHSGQAGTPRQDAKMAFLAAVGARMRDLAADGRHVLVCGDVNVAHREADLRNWRGNRGRAGFLPQERAVLDGWLADGWVDVARRVAGDVEGPYTWWSWRGRAYDNDAGWRIDYQLASAGLGARATWCTVDRAATYAQRWSDHAPVVAGYDLP
jgi:exodeoxyribonuclease III